jgi:hypothetical protein
MNTIIILSNNKIILYPLGMKTFNFDKAIHNLHNEFRCKIHKSFNDLNNIKG